MYSSLGIPLILLLCSPSSSRASVSTAVKDKVEGWIADQDSRSTTQIFESCLFTLFVCTWTALHLNVADPSEGQVKGLLRRLKWMVITFVGPEFIFGHALAELTAAWKSRRYMKDLAEANGCEWTITHGFYANQGGFVLEFRSGIQTTAVESEGKKEIRTINYVGTEHDGNTVQVESNPDLSALGSPPVNANQIRYLAQAGLIAFPKLTSDYIEDKSKGDIFAKGLSCWQVFWLLIQCVVREIRGLPTTPLEISTLAFSACTLGTYAMWLRKPLDIRIPTPILIKPLSATTLEELKSLSTRSIVADFFLVDQLGRGKTTPFHDRIFNDSYFVDRQYVIRFPQDVFVMVDWEFGVLLVSVLFGCLHCIAWNASFPTAIERTLWRVASAFSAGIMPLLYTAGTLVTWIGLKIAPAGVVKNKDLIFSIPIIAASLSYCLGRLYLLAESFASLRSLPPAAFTSTWAADLPSVN